MVRSQRRGKRATASPFFAPMRGASSLQNLLQELAFVLLARGMTPKSFGELSRSAFVHAAAARSKLRNGRVNHSRVAAQTGLTRADVRRLLNRGGSKSPLVPGQTAVERVMNGWLSDQLFSTNLGHPKSLRLSGARPSFTSLSRKYAGDVPCRAVLDELVRMGAATLDGELVHLRSSRELRKRYDFGFLTAVVPILIDGLRIASATANTKPGASMYRLVLPVRTEFDLAFVRDRCTTTGKAMLEGLSHSLAPKIATSRERGKTYSSVAVTILLVENREKRIQPESRRADKRIRHGY
jgi:hypothetical protein